MEERADGVDRVGRDAQADAEGVPRLVTGLGGLQERLEGPVVRLGRGAGGVHRLDVDAGIFLKAFDARAWTFGLTADGRGHDAPFSVALAAIFDGRVYRPVLLD